MTSLTAILITIGIFLVYCVLTSINFSLGVVFFLGTIIWATVDAQKIELKKYQLHGITTPFNTFLGCLLLWLIAFPWYLINKGKIARGEAKLISGQTLKNETSSTSVNINQSQTDTLATLEKLSQLKENGVLTEEEFLAEKAKILSDK